MYIEELTEREEEEEERLVEDKAILMSRGNLILLKTKRTLVGVGARALFSPTLIYNVISNKPDSEFRWWDRVAEFILLGAFPFPYVPQLNELGVCG